MWGNVIQPIGRGLRGFAGGETLFNLLAAHRGVINRKGPMRDRMLERRGAARWAHV